MTAPIVAKITAADEQFNKETTAYQKLQLELDQWQKDFEREVNGQRSGIVGLGPRARSIQDDQLAWRIQVFKNDAENFKTSLIRFISIYLPDDVSGNSQHALDRDNDNHSTFFA